MSDRKKGSDAGGGEAEGMERRTRPPRPPGFVAKKGGTGGKEVKDVGPEATNKLFGGDNDDDKSGK